ncbi:MAG: T9SS type A sorting domain-containing protein [Flavobacteriia bacterium]|nr:T9SS type A sorting domain-containing protein [Flavobacteriia bacterium]
MAVTDSSIALVEVKNITPSTPHIRFVNFDTNGQVLDTLTLRDSSWQLGGCSKCLHFNRGKLYYAATNFTGLRSSELLFLKVRPDLGDTIIKKTVRILDTNLIGQYTWLRTSGNAWATKFDTDSTFILTGYSFRKTFIAPDSVSKYDLHVARFDTAFNLLWSTTVPEVDQTRPEGPIGGDIEIDTYGSVLITGNPYRYSPARLGFAARLRRTDGQLIWYKEYPGGQHGLWGMYCVDNGDGTYQFVQNWSTTPTGGNNYINAGVMDTLGIIIQEKRFLSPSREHAPVDLIRTSDGNYYTAGTTYYGETYSFGFKFTPTLDSLFAIDLYHDQIGNRSEVFNFQEESDGFIVHGGMYIGSSAPGVNSWLIRIDPQGRDTSNCGIGVPEHPQPVAFTFYPNPADHRLIIEWNPQELSMTEGKVFVFDMVGRMLFSKRIGDPDAGIEVLDISEFIPGTYILQLSTESGFSQSETLIIQ